MKNRYHGLKFANTSSESMSYYNEKLEKTSLIINGDNINQNQWDSDNDLTDDQLKKGILLMKL